MSVSITTARAQDDTSGWYEWNAAEDAGPSVIGMAGWLDAPAGQHGGVRMVGDHFEFENGTPVKFWGVNLGNMSCAPPAELGARWADWHAKYGVNCVRLHKFIESGRGGIGDPNDSTKFDPEKLDQFDRFAAEMRKRGMYYGWSWVFGHDVRPADKDRLVAYDELVAAGGGTSRVPVFIGEDIQDLRIEMLVNLLNHTNPYTGLRYADDPALAFVELHNEDSIFFFTFRGVNEPDTLPTYKRMFRERFSNWLKDKYGSHDALVEAWGEGAFDILEIKDEHLDRGNIAVDGNPWSSSPEGLAQARQRGTERRILDTAEFLHLVQGSFYRKFAGAIRDTGYHGPIVGSCWTTPAGVPQYYNLHNDYEVGLIDRHSYFGGGLGQRPTSGKFENEAQLDNPGSGMFSSGLLQVVDRPFAMSEWTNVIPNEWLLEGPAIFAAYGMGLQGWDASYQFASHVLDYEGKMFASRVDDPRVWVVDIPNQIGLYPALARMVYRGDVKEAPVISTRRVSLQELRDGEPEWINQEEIQQSWDFKDYTGAVSSAALAVGRVVVEFVDEPAESDIPDVSAHTRDGAIRSVTGQLAWTPASGEQRGHFTIDTAGTKAVVGFLPDETVTLGDVSFRSDNPFAGLFLTALSPDGTIADDEGLLLTAMARVRNTGQRISADGTELLDMGTGPMLVEPIVAEVSINGRPIKEVRVLDQDGRRTAQTLPVENGTFGIDGSRDKTMYYEIVME